MVPRGIDKTCDIFDERNEVVLRESQAQVVLVIIEVLVQVFPSRNNDGSLARGERGRD
jgi:hypothetical protein